MDFILNEAFEEDKDFKLVFSDDSNEEFTEGEEEFSSADEEFIDDAPCEEEQDDSFYRNLNNRDEYIKFPNQMKNPIEVVEEPEEDYFGEDDISELFDPENREEVDFDLFYTDTDKSSKFKNSLLCFANVDNHFFMLLFTALCTTN